MRILFVCLGNICRSPMAEFVFRDMAIKAGKGNAFEVASAATSYEEEGNGVHHGTRRILDQYKVPYTARKARRMTKEDYAYYDLIVGMEQSNIRNILRITGGDPFGKVRLLIPDYDVADPWYTGNFEDTYRDVVKGCRALLEEFEAEE